jgi:hypothetical protein
MSIPFGSTLHPSPGSFPHLSRTQLAQREPPYARCTLLTRLETRAYSVGRRAGTCSVTNGVLDTFSQTLKPPLGLWSGQTERMSETHSRERGSAITALGLGPTLVDVKEPELSTRCLDHPSAIGAGVVAILDIPEPFHQFCA